MTTKVLKIGNSLGIYISKQIADKINIVQGAPVSLYCESDRIIIKPIKEKETLKGLLSKINQKNRHELVDFYEDVGNEII